MKKGFLALVGLFTLASFIFYSCSKQESTGCTGVSAASEKSAMVTFANSKGITYTEHSSGMLYQITNAGSGLQPNLNSRIKPRLNQLYPERPDSRLANWSAANPQRRHHQNADSIFLGLWL